MRGSLPTPVRYLYGKLSVCKTDFLFSANPEKYWQDVRTKYIPEEKNTTKFYFY